MKVDIFDHRESPLKVILCISKLQHTTVIRYMWAVSTGVFDRKDYDTIQSTTC